MDAIVAEGLVKIYRSRKSEVRALDGLDLTVPEGMFSASSDLTAQARRRRSASCNPSGWRGKAKIAATATEVDSGSDALHFNIDIQEVVITRLNEAGTRLVIQSWNPVRGYRQQAREQSSRSWRLFDEPFVTDQQRQAVRQ